MPNNEYDPERKTEILSDIRDLTPYEFEKFIAVLCELRGWKARVTNETGDGGIDILARKSYPFEVIIRIQAKRYHAGNKVGSPEVQKYTPHRGDNTDISVMVTSSSFTSQAMSIAEKSNVKLINGDTLTDIILQLDAVDILEEFLKIDDISQIDAREFIISNQYIENRHRGRDILYLIDGIGSKEAKKLSEVEVDTLEDLATTNSKEVAKETGLSKKQLERWINSAVYFEEIPVTGVRGIGPKITEQLSPAGIEKVGDLAQASPEELAERTNLSTEHLEKLVARAAKRPGEPLTVLSGIGSGRADRLNEIGIHSIADLAVSNPEDLESVKYINKKKAKEYISRTGGRTS